MTDEIRPPIDLEQEVGDFDVRQQTVRLRFQELRLGRRVVLGRADLQALVVDAGIRQFVGTGQPIGILECLP